MQAVPQALLLQPPLSASNLSNVVSSTSAEIPARRKVAELSLLDAIVSQMATGEVPRWDNGARGGEAAARTREDGHPVDRLD